MNNSREEERSRRRVTSKADSKPGGSSTSNQPANSKDTFKQKNEKKNKGKSHSNQCPQDLEKLFHELMNFPEGVNVCEDIFPFVPEYVCPFQNNRSKLNECSRLENEALYICPDISDEVLPEREWLQKIQDYISLVNESDPILSAVLAVRSLNPKQKADECFSVITKFLKNIIDCPEKDKYRHIRCGNPIVESKLMNTEGAVLFMETIGFQIEINNELSEPYLTFKENHYHLNEVVNLIKSVKGFQLTPFEEIPVGEAICSDGSRGGEDFYKLTSADLKKNQRLRALEIEKESQLRTKSTREKEKRLVPKSKFTKIRIRSPEGNVLESTFEISDKLLQVYQFIDRNMAKGREYVLFMPPATPFKDDDKGKTLADLQLFPAVLITLKWLQADKKGKKGK